MRADAAVADVMRDHVIAVRERATYGEIVEAMRRYGISSLPVVDSEDRVVGLISGYDLLGEETGEAHAAHGGLLSGPLGGPLSGLLDRLRRRGERPDVRSKVATDLMSTPAVTVTAATPAAEAARAMYRRGIHQLPVVDAVTGRLIGLVTRSDLLAAFERPDEDIRREILYDVIERALAMPPERFEVTCVGGTVTIRGRLERRSAALRLAAAITQVGGVITIVDELTYELDDTATLL